MKYPRMIQGVWEGWMDGKLLVSLLIRCVGVRGGAACVCVCWYVGFHPTL